MCCLFFSLALFFGCQSDNTLIAIPTDIPSDWVTLTDSETEFVFMESVPIPLENCSGNSPVRVNINRDRSTTTSIELSVGGEVETSIPEIVKAKIETSLTVQRGESNSFAFDVQVSVEPATQVQYELIWNETWQVGIAIIDELNLRIPYRVRTGLQPRLSSGEPQLCDGTLDSLITPSPSSVEPQGNGEIATMTTDIVLTSTSTSAPTQTATQTSTPSATSVQYIDFTRMAYFDGFNDYIEIPSFTGLNLRLFTIEAWIKAEEFHDWDGVLSKGVSISSFGIQLWSDRTIRFKGGGNTWNSTIRLAINTWQHIAITFDGSTIRFFINGERDPFQIDQLLTLNHNTEPLIIGADLPIDNEFFKGSIGEVRIWNYARTSQEIRATMNNRLSGLEDGLIGYWPLYDIEDDVAEDVVGGNDGNVYR